MSTAMVVVNTPSSHTRRVLVEKVRGELYFLYLSILHFKNKD
jgi:hypothetical protein